MLGAGVGRLEGRLSSALELSGGEVALLFLRDEVDR